MAVSSLLLMCSSAHADCITLFVHPGAARAVLLDPAVRMYLHTDLASRRPLLVSDRLLLAKESDLILPFQVLIVRGNDARQSKAFRFTSAEPGERDAIVVTFEFPPEGILGRVTLRHTKNGWIVLTREVVES